MKSKSFKRIVSILNVKLWVPNTYEAFEEYRMGGVNFSKTAINTNAIDQLNFKNTISKREIVEIKIF